MKVDGGLAGRKEEAVEEEDEEKEEEEGILARSWLKTIRSKVKTLQHPSYLSVKVHVKST